MAAKWNWRKLGIGSGAVVAALSTVFALNPKGNERNNAVDINEVIVHTDGRDGKNSIRFPGKFMMAAPGTTPERKLEDAIKESRKLCKRIKNEMGLPGLTVAVSVNGKLMWQEGFGYSNLENSVKMKAESVMRIASISKSMTMAMMAKLMEEGKVNIDLPIQTYLPTFPEKFVDGEKVTITTRHLLSHLSGIRHYVRKESEGKGNENDPEDMNVDKTPKKAEDKSKPKKKKEVEEMDLQEYFLKEKFASVEDSMKLFKDDELFHKPGTQFFYTTHGWTVVSAIIEKLTETEFTKYSTRMFDFWGLKNTFLDFHEPLIHNRASYYTRLKNGQIINSPYVDNSYKWAGGGFLSTVADLNQFGNILLYSMQSNESSETCENGLPKRPFLKQSTMKTMWTGNPATQRPEVPDFLYALGFRVGEPLRKCVFCKERDLKTVCHGGAAVGASSYLLLAFPPLPSTDKNCDNSQKPSDVQGVVVSMITNLTSIGLSKSAEEIAENFRGLI